MHLTARVAEIALTVKFADVPRRFRADAVDRADEITVGDGVRGLFEFPEIFAQTRNGCRRIKNNFRAVQTETSRAFGKMAVVADINADSRKRRVETRITQDYRGENKIFPRNPD